MRNISFALTTPQIEAQVKDVTRRLGWQFLQEGMLLRPVKKCMGLKKGESIEQVGNSLIRVVRVSHEPLIKLIEDLEYGYDEVRREGFADHDQYGQPQTWVDFFCASHRGCTPQTVVTRIEFKYQYKEGMQ